MRLSIIAGLVLMVGTAYGAEPPIGPDRAGYDKKVAPFFGKYCNKCHAAAKPKGDFGVDPARLLNDFADVGARGKWKEVVNVLNAHQMPPDEARQPRPDEVATVVDWITAETVRAEVAKRERGVVLRRINREEYRNTIRDLLGVDFDPEGFPQDPPAGGFDNNGGALTVSPLHMEMYLAAAQQIVDRVIVSGPRPPVIRWRFEPKVGPPDRRRVPLDAKNNAAIVNGGLNRQEGEWVVVGQQVWDRGVDARNFQVPVAGTYAIRVRAAGRIPTREQVVTSADKLLREGRDQDSAKHPQSKQDFQKRYEQYLAHFQTDRMYDYGPPRVKLVQRLGPQPRVVAEFDADGTPSSPKTHTFHARFTTESAGLNLIYAYQIPTVVENWWVQRSDAFARPEMMIAWFEIEGPLYDAWPPSNHTRLLPPASPKTTTESAYARKVLEGFLRRAYRRPVSPAEVSSKLALFTQVRKEKPALEAIKVPLIAALASPHFLFLAEPGSDGPIDESSPLNDHELATRLSYFLWSSMPDEPLFELADRGQLRSAKVLEAQVDRMLADEKAGAFVRNFAGQWLGLREVGANPPAAELFPRYDRHLETSIVGESEAYFREFLANDLDVRQMIRSDFVVINERLARFYGIPGVRGDEFRRVKVPPGVHRGGIVTQASILSTTSNGTRTSPVKRGTWIMKTLLGTDPGLPVANVGEIAPKVPGIDKATVRKRLEVHRTLAQCARCHSKIDPLGFALENYDASGEWRVQEAFGSFGRIQRNDPPIDASSVMPDGTRIEGVAGLQRAILKKSDLFLDCLASKLMTYAYGRELGLADQPTVKTVVARVKANHYTLRSLIKAIVTSKPFGTK